MNFYILIPREEFESTVRKIKIFLPAALEFFSCLYINFLSSIFFLLFHFLITIITLPLTLIYFLTLITNYLFIIYGELIFLFIFSIIYHLFYSHHQHIPTRLHLLS